MALPDDSPRAMPTMKRALQVPSHKGVKQSKSTWTASSSNPSTVAAAKNDPDLVKDFRSDLQSIRALVTCTICDQLLYEPWTLLCGHTYCYSCLCSWFLPNRRKKTCPDCRSVVRQMPAPSFVIKQMVEILIKRAELMPIDETSDQHQERKTSENNIVERDRTSELGLFKGCFSKQPSGYLQFNEEDRIYRCSRCAHEYIDGPICENCGVDLDRDEEEVDMDGFSDVDADLSVDEFSYHVDLDALSDDDDDDDTELDDSNGLTQGPVSFLRAQGSPHFIHPWAFSRTRTIRGPREVSISSNSENSEEEEETESMRDFIEDDGDVYNAPSSYHSPGSASHISLGSRGPVSVDDDDDEDDDDDDDDEDESSDEGGAVSAGNRRNQVAWAAAIGTHSAPRVSESATTSEAGDLAEESRRLQESGWSPLEQEPESDFGERGAFVTHGGSTGSDTDTTVGNQASDEEDDGSHRDNGSATPLWGISGSNFLRGRRTQSVESRMTEEQIGLDGYESDVHETNFTDREGDVEMSVSPVSSRRSSTASNTPEQGARRSVEILGPARAMHEPEDDSSDGTVQPANRRRRAPRYFRHSQTTGIAGYDPRISMMFAQHQLDLLDVTARQSPYFEPAPRSRPTTSYRHMSAWGSGLPHHPSVSSAVILTSVSNWPNRVQRQYHRRYFN